MRRVERLQQPARQPVDLDGGDRTVLGERAWHRAEEVANAGRRFEHAPAGEAEALHGLPHGLDHMNLGVVAVVDRGAGRFVVLGGQQGLQFPSAAAPHRVRAFEVEGGGQAAPAGEAQQLAALDGIRLALAGFEGLQGLDCGHIGLELGGRAGQAGQVLALQRGPRGAGRVALGAGDHAPIGAWGRARSLGFGIHRRVGHDCGRRKLDSAGNRCLGRGWVSKQIRLDGRLWGFWGIRVEARQPQGGRSGACHRWFSEGRRGTHRPIGGGELPGWDGQKITAQAPCARAKGAGCAVDGQLRTAVAAGRVSTATPERARERPKGRALAGARLRGSVCGWRP